METVAALIMVAITLERILNGILSFCMFGMIPVTFVVFLALFIIEVIKVKKKGGKKVKAIVFGCISGYFLLGVIGEIAFVAMLSAALAHM